MRNLIVAALTLSLAGCAGGMSKDECLYADWRAVGYEDGARGLAASAISSRRQACAKKAEITVDMDAYLAGRDAGLGEYCRPANGFAVGARGARYYGVCSDRQEAAFVAAHQNGHQLYSLTSVSAHAAEAVHAAEHELERIHTRIDHVEAALVSPTTPHLERIDYLLERKQLEESKDRIKADLYRLSDNYEDAQDDLADYRAYLDEEGAYESGVVSPTNARY